MPSWRQGWRASWALERPVTCRGHRTIPSKRNPLLQHPHSSWTAGPPSSWWLTQQVVGMIGGQLTEGKGKKPRRVLAPRHLACAAVQGRTHLTRVSRKDFSCPLTVAVRGFFSSKWTLEWPFYKHVLVSIFYMQKGQPRFLGVLVVHF